MDLVPCWRLMVYALRRVLANNHLRDCYSEAGAVGGYTNEQIAEASERIGQVKDVLPGFGDGFLTAALLVRNPTDWSTGHRDLKPSPSVESRRFRGHLAHLVEQKLRNLAIAFTWLHGVGVSRTPERAALLG